MKVCSKCKIELNSDMFHKDKNTKDGLTSNCKICRRKCTSIWQSKHKKHRALYSLEFKKTHKDHLSKYRKKYNKAIVNKTRESIRRKNQLETNPQYKLQITLRSRLKDALRWKKSYKTGSAVKDLGISIAEFRIYIESMFRDGMTWENHGKVWHLDHIKPLASFDLSDREQFLIAANWKNYQPLLVHENLTKHCKFN